MDDKKYNGWTNWETWNAHLWMDNEEWSQKEMMRCRNAESLKGFWKIYFLDTDDIDIEKINFEEIFSHYEEG